MSWQEQEAEERFSEVLRAVGRDGPQTISRHGEDVAVVLDIVEYRRLTGQAGDAKDVLLGPPYVDTVADVISDIESERSRDRPQDVDLESH